MRKLCRPGQEGGLSIRTEQNRTEHNLFQTCTKYMTVTILLYNEFPSRNLVRREENDAMV